MGEKPGSEKTVNVRVTGRSPMDAVRLDKKAYSVAEVASLTGFSVGTITRLFEHEPGVLILERPERLHKRRHRSIRIPQHVYQRVIERLLVQSA
jgi:hypothetical protein